MLPSTSSLTAGGAGRTPRSGRGPRPASRRPGSRSRRLATRRSRCAIVSGSSSSESDAARRISPGSRPAASAIALSRCDFGASCSDGAEAVPHVGVARRDRHHALLARRADPDRRVRLLHRTRAQRRVLDREVLALEREVVGGEQPAHDLHRLLERVDALLQRRERDPELGGAPCRTTPRRTTSSSRPPDAWSMVIASAANTDGCR